MIKRLAGCVREYKRPSLLAPIFVSGEVVLEVIIPYIMAWLIDRGVDAGSMKHILLYGGLLLALALLSLLFGVLAGKNAAIASCGFGKNMRKDMYYNIQNFSFSNIDKFSSASLVTRLTTDVTNVQNAYQMLVRVAVRCPVMLVSAVIMTCLVSVKIALVFLCVLPVLGVGLFLIIKNAYPLFTKVFKTFDKLNSVVQENLRGIRVVKAFVREDYEREKFGAVSGEMFNISTAAEKLVALNAPLMMSSIYFCMLMISWLGAKSIVAGSLTTGNLTSLFTYTMQILMSLMMVSMVFVMITMSRASMERISEVLAERSDIVSKEGALTEVPNGSVVFKNVGFSYSGSSERLCLSGIDISIKSGETIGIIGSTGSSKSTLVQMIPRLYDATQGEVIVGGHDVRDYDLDALRDSVAMVLQKNVLFSGTIKENLRWGDENATDAQLAAACRLAQADGFIKEFPDGYDTYIEQGGANVSGGQRQRLCIARALLKKPKILILDDSTSAVDTATDALIRKAMREEIPNTTKFIIAQRISSVQDADRIIVMEGGKVNGFGTHEQLLANNDIYREVYNSQVKGGGENE